MKDLIATLMNRRSSYDDGYNTGTLLNFVMQFGKCVYKIWGFISNIYYVFFFIILLNSKIILWLIYWYFANILHGVLEFAQVYFLMYIYLCC